MSHRPHVLVATLEDKPGVLNRVTALFRRRNYNITSLNVGRTHEPGVSRMTLVIDTDDDGARRIQANLYKLVNVLAVQDLTNGEAVLRDLALVKVRAGAQHRSAVLELVNVFRARVVDIDDESLMVEVSGTSDKLEAFLRMVSPFGVSEMVQSGTVALGRGAARLPTSLGAAERAALIASAAE